MSRRNIGITIITALAVILLWWFFLWSPRVADLQDARDRTENAEQENGLLELQLARLEALAERSPELRADLEKLRAAVPDTPDLASLILELDEMAARSGVELPTITPSLPGNPLLPGGPPQISLPIQVTGGYFQVVDFINRLSSNPRLFAIDAINIASSPTDAGGIELVTALTLRVFVTQIPPFDPETVALLAEAEAAVQQSIEDIEAGLQEARDAAELAPGPVPEDR